MHILSVGTTSNPNYMIRIFTLLLISLLLTSCVHVRSVVDNSGQQEPYSNPLVVINCSDNGIHRYSKELKENLEKEFKAENRNVEILVIEESDNALILNPKDDTGQKIKSAISKDRKDLLLVVQPVDLYYNNGSLQLAVFSITGTDARTQKEIWKAQFSTQAGPIGSGMFVKKSARKIYENLKADKVL